jgi:hypothetical protein
VDFVGVSGVHGVRKSCPNRAARGSGFEGQIVCRRPQESHRMVANTDVIRPRAAVLVGGIVMTVLVAMGGVLMTDQVQSVLCELESPRGHRVDQGDRE